MLRMVKLERIAYHEKRAYQMFDSFTILYQLYKVIAIMNVTNFSWNWHSVKSSTTFKTMYSVRWA